MVVAQEEELVRATFIRRDGRSPGVTRIDGLEVEDIAEEGAVGLGVHCC
jgi:hypothetical protein